MAEIVEEVSEIEAVEAKEAVQELEAQEEVKEQVSSEPELPERYRGKSLAEIAKMHQEAEKLIGHKANEVQEMRKLADELIKMRIGEQKPQESGLKDESFFERPLDTVNQAIASNPDFMQVRQELAQIGKERAVQNLMQKHPDAMTISASEDFQAWVKASPIRSQLFKQADSGYDVVAADELLSTFKEIKQIKAAQRAETFRQSEIAEKEARKTALKSAGVDTGGTGEVSKKTYSRTALMKMMINDPAGYASLADSGELARAYREGRVK